MALYRTEDFLLADPIPRWARNSGQRLTWTRLIALLSERDRGRKVVEAAAQFGFTEGTVVPVRSRDNSLGLILFEGGRAALSLAEQVFLRFTIPTLGQYSRVDQRDFYSGRRF